MAEENSLHFYPKRVLWIGGAGLCFGLFCFFLLWIVQREPAPFCLKERKGKEEARDPLIFSLGLCERVLPVLPLPDLRGEMSVSFDPPRPDGVKRGTRVLARLKKSGEIKRAELPCRLDLEYQGDKLVFANAKSPFFIELKGTTQAGRLDELIEVKGEAGTFSLSVQECPIRASSEFEEGSPFRILAEARWLGRDQFQESGERLEMGELLDVKETDWLVWKGQKWQKLSAPEKGCPIARIQGVGRTLLLEGWDLEGYVRIALNSVASLPFKMKGEDLFTSVRVRSEKKVSCMLEKQCMILKTGDWVFKSNGRWKLLRKKEEQEAFISGKLLGELFVFEQIGQKQGQKVIQGRLFNPGRTQMVPIEVAVQTSRKTKGNQKGKTP